MKIALLTSGLPPERIGGAEIQAAQIAAFLADEHDILVLTRSSEATPELAANEHITVHRRTRVSLPLLRFPADLVSSLITIGARRRELQLIISYQTVIDGLIAALARVMFGIPVLHSVRSRKEYRLRENLSSRLFAPFVFRRVDRLAVQSESIEEELLKELSASGRRSLVENVRRKLCILPNGIHLPPTAETEGETVLYVGRLVRLKGVAHLLEAMRQCPGERLVVVGDGPEMGRLQAAAGDMPNVEFAGRVHPDQVQVFMRGAKMLVLPSLHDEAQSNAVMQAMAHGKPVIASRGAGISDLVTDGETGYLVEPGDVSALTGRIRDLGADEELRRRMGAKGMEAIRRYSWPNVLRLVNRELARFQTASD